MVSDAPVETEALFTALDNISVPASNEEGLQKTKNKLIFIGRQIDIDADTFITQLRSLRDAALKNNEKISSGCSYLISG